MRRKFFIHITKTGGMTVRHGLKGKILIATRDNHISKVYSDKLLATMNRYKDHHGYEHARWRDIRVDLKKNCDFFAIVRNPWARVVSRYCFAKKVIEVEKKVPKEYADISTFEAFLEERWKWGNKEFFWHRAVRSWYPQIYHVLSETGQLKCDILRTEYLDTDLMKYFKLSTSLKPRNVTALKTKPYTEFYNSTTLNIIGDWYSKDIEFFGFDFNTSATKNIWNH